MTALGVAKTAENKPVDDQSWLVNRMNDGVMEVTLDLSTFIGDAGKEKKYLTSTSDSDSVSWIKSGVPLARITATGLYGPYDSTASDGRQNAVDGVLESLTKIEWVRGGLKNTRAVVGMRYMAVIDKAKLPVDVGTAKFNGLFIDCPKSAPKDRPVTQLSQAVAKA